MHGVADTPRLKFSLKVQTLLRVAVDMNRIWGFVFVFFLCVNLFLK